MNKGFFWSCDISWLASMFYFAGKANGEPNSCIRGLAFTICKIINTYKPKLFVGAEDSKLSFRKELCGEYKANRPKRDEEYIDQINQVYELMNALGIPVISVDGFEGDDIMANLCEEAKKLEIPYVAVCKDKDFFQCLETKKFGMWNKVSKGPWNFYSQIEAEKKWGVTKDKFISTQVLWGDSCDNIRGVQGLGLVKSAKLLNKYNTIEGIYENIKDLSESTQKNLENFRPRLDTVRKLVTLVKDCGNFGNVLEHYSVSEFHVNRPELHKILVRNDILNLENLLLETLNSD